MREIKPTEVRKQEILEGAIKVFQAKGYYRTSISDIAASLNISQGLCYRYFKSKEEIFELAVDVYAQSIADPMIREMNRPEIRLPELIKSFPDFTNMEQEHTGFYDLFHGQESDSFHDSLSLKICGKVYPHVKGLLEAQCKAGTLQLHDPETMASFLVYGQLGILLDKGLSMKEKNRRIMQFLETILSGTMPR